ncbi:hypothetical protein EYF80_065738 [Liparis tanakae]|uniref:Uncharacterized protein n=1 Tax=Liparis tanakae TaxID=230148 RepID=A0A4Z2E5V5_9TELE|nr:hypothetical protein EYF80_065738 [Liparis tanakae]
MCTCVGCKYSKVLYTPGGVTVALLTDDVLLLGQTHQLLATGSGLFTMETQGGERRSNTRITSSPPGHNSRSRGLRTGHVPVDVLHVDAFTVSWWTRSLGCCRLTGVDSVTRTTGGTPKDQQDQNPVQTSPASCGMRTHGPRWVGGTVLWVKDLFLVVWQMRRMTKMQKQL